MIRKAIAALVLSAVVVIFLLTLLGFRPHHFIAMFQKPYEQALKDGDYLEITTIWSEKRVLSGEYDFKMIVKNPTPRPLRLIGKWNWDQTSRNVQLIGPTTLDIETGPESKKEMKMQLVISKQPDQAPAQEQTRGERAGRGGEGSPGSSAQARTTILVSKFKGPVFEGVFEWEKFAPAGKEGDILTAPVKRQLRTRLAFGRLNYLVLFAYLLGMVAIGAWTSRHIKDARGFFIAEGKLNYVIVGLSILGTYLSALTMMALPGMSFGEHNWTYTVQLPCLVITAIIITGFVLPRYRKAGIISIYEFLEQRIHVSARLVTSICFIIFAIGRMGLVLYLPALAFSTVTGTPLWLAIVAMGIVITIYTVMGGMEAVVWTDAIQVVILVFGALLTLFYVFRQIGVDTFIAIGVEYDKFQVVIPEFNIYKITTLWLVLETLYQTVRIYGTQQDIAQRYMTTESTEKANLSVWIAIVAYIPIGFIFYFIGTALYAFYKSHPDVNLPGRADPMYPHFIINHMPAGIAGLVIAAIFAAAMSSIDSCMNSSSTVCVEDFYKRFSKSQRSDRDYLGQARWLTLVWGAAAIVMALLFMEIKYAQIVWGKLMGISTNGILGLMALAFLPFRVNKWAAMTGFVLSYAALFAMMASGVIFLLWPVIGNTVCFLVAIALHPIYAGIQAGVQDSSSLDPPPENHG